MQRVTAFIIGVYTVYLVTLIISHHPVSYDYWRQLWNSTGIKVFSLIVLCSILWHAWIGLWTVFTDYVKPIPIRVGLEIIVCGLLIIYLYWGISILWG